MGRGTKHLAGTDVLLESRQVLELTIESVVLVAPVRSELGERRRGVPPVDREVPAAGAVSDQLGTEVARGAREEHGPPAVRPVRLLERGAVLEFDLVAPHDDVHAKELARL